MSRIESILEKATLLRNNNAIEKPKIDPSVTSIRPDIFEVDSMLNINNPFLVTITDPGSPITEEYKKLKSIILKLTNSGNFKNTIMVTSTVPGEGKSITAINLAVALAQEYDHSVLLVDTDLRKPSIPNYLGIQVGMGLTDCLTKGVDVSEVLVKTGIGKLILLPAGSRVDNPVELLSSSKMLSFFKDIKNRYNDRYVIFDTPPVLSFAEAHAIGSIVDGVVFVVREGCATIHNVKEAINTIRGANILGLVYNDVEISRYDQDYRYNYYGSNYINYGAK